VRRLAATADKLSRLVISKLVPRIFAVQSGNLKRPETNHVPGQKTKLKPR
jgi:hypothetical protein